ncbi:hypothetical protein HYT17_01675, partial [Candidatus Microgenomates bacterium]|nr:hypothetical protein [Candidatus Microgenomates bacterium]
MRKTIVVGVTGSIAAYKTLALVKSLKKQGSIVYVVMTRGACSLVDEKEFAKASSNPVRIEMFEPEIDYQKYLAKDKPMEHISLADE